MQNVEFIGIKISTDLVQVTTQFSDKQVYSAKLKCPFCLDDITVIHADSSNGSGIWKTASFDNHLINIHQDEKCKRLKDGLSLGVDWEQNSDAAVPTCTTSEEDEQENCTAKESPGSSDQLNLKEIDGSQINGPANDVVNTSYGQLLKGKRPR